jgi:hypothetical protein
MSKSQIEIVQNAGHLATGLRTGMTPVTKNALLSVVATFMSDPSGNVDRLSRTLELLKAGSGGHLKRGGGFGEQVHLVIQEVERLLERGEWEPKDLKSLFGWTARLLQVRQANRAPEREDSRPARDDRRDSRPGRPSEPSRRPSSGRMEKKAPAPPATPFRAVNSKNLDVLKAFGKKLSDPTGEGS